MCFNYKDEIVNYTPEFIRDSICLDIFNDTDFQNNFLFTNTSTEIYINVKCGQIQSNGKNCFYDDKFREKFYGKYFNMYFIDNLINLDNITNPFLNKLQKDNMFINPILGKFIDIVYNNLQLENDFGIIFEKLDFLNTIKVESVQHNYMINDYPMDYSKNDINMITVKITFNENAVVYRRIYIKLQNVFAEVAAIFRVIIILGGFIVDRFSIKMFYSDMINEHFCNYDEHDEPKGLSIFNFQNKNIIENNQNLLQSLKEIEKNDKNLEKHKSIVDNSFKSSNYHIIKNLDRLSNKIIKREEECNFNENELKNINKIDANNININHSPDININLDISDLNFSDKRILYQSKAKYNSDITNRSNNFINLEKLKSQNFSPKEEDRRRDEKNYKNLLSTRLKSYIQKKKEDIEMQEKKSIELSNRDKKTNTINSIDLSDNSKHIIEHLVNSISNVKKKILKFSYLSCLYDSCPKKFLNKNYLENEKNYQKFLTKIKNIFELDKVLSIQKSIDLIKKIFFDDEQIKAMNLVNHQFSDCENKPINDKDMDNIKNYFLQKNVFSNIDIMILKLLISNVK